MTRLPAADRALFVSLVTRLGLYAEPKDSIAVSLAENGEEELAFENLLQLLIQQEVPLTEPEFDAFIDFGERHDAVADWLEVLDQLRSQIVKTLS